MTFWKCSFCNFMYDDWYGDSRNGVPAGISLPEIAGSLCSRCGMQGARHKKQASPFYTGMEAEYYDQFAGKAGIAFYRNWLLEQEMSPVVLELGVGTGRIATEVAEKAGAVCGVDWSPDMLKVAKTKRDRIFRGKTERLELLESDVMDFDSGKSFSHIICSDGLFQHFTHIEDQIALLQRIRSNLQEGGSVAIDLMLPPAGEEWKTARRKRLPNGKVVYQQVAGETSLRRQLFHFSVTYEAFIDGVEQTRYRIEREYSLLTPKELGLLLSMEGFKVTHTYENYGLSKPWRTALLTEVQPMLAPLHPDETLDEVLGVRKDNLLRPYQEDVWVNGGYPFDTEGVQANANHASRFTLIAKVC
ncbi:class I SAM-dependent methyltransferase [Brevibacillus daliensis]|uniref:class I SAM-dependent methyltransferase n=1 Tax=Brevibacillus daliensis TaxID=2892995 RepID=UPI001E60F31E|nr:class I SAM-dependent methyltransferase [Brevibacillus daliensis]